MTRLAMTEKRKRIVAMWWWGALAINSVALALHNASIAWPRSWALNERWPWWFHAAFAVVFVALWKVERDRGKP